jgi:hypothetical protein
LPIIVPYCLFPETIPVCTDSSTAGSATCRKTNPMAGGGVETLYFSPMTVNPQEK